MHKKVCRIIGKKFFSIITIGKLQSSAGLQLKFYKLNISILLKYIMKKLTEEDEIGYIEFNIIQKNTIESEIQQFRVKEKFRNQRIGKALITTGKEILIQYYNAEILTVCPISFPYPGESSFPIKNLYFVYQKLGFEPIDKNADLDKSGSKMYMKLN